MNPIAASAWRALEKAARISGVRHFTPAPFELLGPAVAATLPGGASGVDLAGVVVDAPPKVSCICNGCKSKPL
jgi:hypothetical protein